VQIGCTNKLINGPPSRPEITRLIARRKGMSIADVERWLAPNLGYES